MHRHCYALLAYIVGLILACTAKAECVSASNIQDIRKAYAEGEAHEAAGRAAEAIEAYLRAQQPLCTGTNPVDVQAARRAAPLAQKLAQEAERKGKLIGYIDPYGKKVANDAFHMYEAGGYFAEADRILLQALKARPDDVELYAFAQTHFMERSEAGFHEIHRPRLQAVGAYRLDQRQYDEVMAKPEQNLLRLLEEEKKLFDEAYLRDFAELLRHQEQMSMSMDSAAIQQAQATEHKFRSKWQRDLVEESQDKLQLARQWLGYAQSSSEPLMAKLEQRALERADLLLNRYATTPQLLENAMEYSQFAESDKYIEAVVHKARQLGKEAMAASRYQAAEHYFQIASDEEAVTLAMEKLEEQKEQLAADMRSPYVDQTEAIRHLMSNPALQEAMRQKVEQLMQSMQKPGDYDRQRAELEQALGL